MPWFMLAGSALGMMKGNKDEQQAERDRKLAAETVRYSPWTHLQAQPVKEANKMGDVMQGAMQGYAMDQNMAAAKETSALNQAKIGWYNRGAGGAYSTPTDAEMYGGR